MSLFFWVIDVSLTKDVATLGLNTEMYPLGNVTRIFNIRHKDESESATLVMCFLGAFAKLRKGTVSFVMSVSLSAWNNSTPTGRIFMKFDI
jgi:hypothetical protein